MQPLRPRAYASPELFSIRELFPAMMKAQAFSAVKPLLTSEEFAGSAPAPFVGRFGYPHVQVGILSPPRLDEQAWELDAPRHWSLSNYSIAKIVQLRSQLVNSRFLADIRRPAMRAAGVPESPLPFQAPVPLPLVDGSGSGTSPARKLLEVSQEVAMASKPVDIEFRLKEKPSWRLNLSPEVAPTGPAGHLLKVAVTSNPSIPRKVDAAVSDVDLKAVDALSLLHDKGVDENSLTRLLSVGTLGVKAQRRLVPTRWSITAVDDTLGKAAIGEVKDFQLLGEHRLYVGEYFGNRFHVLLLPEVWGYELFETFLPTLSMLQSEHIKYTTDSEGYSGRTAYAEHCAGGYYAARLPVLERLRSLHRQARAIIIRVISEEYAMPLGVWVVREAVRKAMASEPLMFSSREELLAEVRSRLSSGFGIGADYFLRRSVLLNEAREQRKLAEFA